MQMSAIQSTRKQITTNYNGSYFILSTTPTKHRSAPPNRDLGIMFQKSNFNPNALLYASHAILRNYVQLYFIVIAREYSHADPFEMLL